MGFWLNFRFFGHSFFEICSKHSLLIDPFLSTSIKGDCALKLPSCKNKLSNVSLILITHEHKAHFDKKLVEFIAKKCDSLVVAHDSILNNLELPKRQLVPVMLNSEINVRNVEIQAFPAHHPLAFYPLSFLLKINGLSVFHAGDTELMDEHEKIKADVALLPIGGSVTMDLVDAVKATKCIKPKIAIPMHYNTFPSIKAEPLEFKARIEKSNLKTKPVILKPGESFEF